MHPQGQNKQRILTLICTCMLLLFIVVVVVVWKCSRTLRDIIAVVYNAQKCPNNIEDT